MVMPPAPLASKETCDELPSPMTTASLLPALDAVRTSPVRAKLPVPLSSVDKPNTCTPMPAASVPGARPCRLIAPPPDAIWLLKICMPSVLPSGSAAVPTAAPAAAVPLPPMAMTPPLLRTCALFRCTAPPPAASAL
jgi:hypothetical protein